MPKLIRFKGHEFILDEEGTIATKENYRDCLPSYAHYFPETNIIMRFREQIGTSADIEILDENYHIERNTDKFFENMNVNWYDPKNSELLSNAQLPNSVDP